MHDSIIQLERKLYQLIEENKLTLPTLPEVAIQVRTAMNDDEIGIAQLTKVIERDTALSARIIRVANSPIFRGQATIADIQSAVNRLGKNYAGNLATGLAMEQMFTATDPMIDKKLREVWSTSTLVASIAHVLAKSFSKLPADQATLAGLMHRIGVLPIIAFAEAYPNVIKSEQALDNVIEQIQGGLGTHLLDYWGFAEDVTKVPEQCQCSYREVDAADLADLILVARLQSQTDESIDYSKVSAFQRLGLSHEIEELEAEHVDDGEDQRPPSPTYSNIFSA